MPRKLLIIAVCAMLGVGMATAQAIPESKVVWGARLSMDITFPAGSSNPYKVGSGFSAGAVAAVALPRNFYFEPGLLFYFTAMTAKDLVRFDNEYFYEGTGRIYGLKVPLSVGYRFYVADDWRLSVSTGPYVNFNISARQKLNPNMSAPVPLPDKTVNLFEHGWKHVDAGWQISLSTTFADSYFVGVTGGVNFTPLASYGNPDKKIKIYRSSVAISVGYNF